MMDSNQMVETGSSNITKPASSTPSHSIDKILGLAARKRGAQEMEDPGNREQENNGKDDVDLLGFAIMRKGEGRETFLKALLAA